MKRKLTDTHLRNVKPKESRYEVRDGGGLALWVYPTGRRSWVYTYEIAGKKRRKVLGEYPAMGLAAAREAHETDRAIVERGTDPVEAKREQKAREAAEKAALEAKKAEEELAPTVERLIELYLEKWAKPNKRSWAEDQRQLEKDVKPRLGKLKARDVTRRHVREVLEAVVERGAPVTANRLLTVTHRMFAWAAEREIIPASPCNGVRMPAKELPKDRVLSPEEVRAFWRAIETLPAPIERKGRPRTQRRDDGAHAVTDPVRRALKLILVTAQRPGEVVGMTWDEIEGSWWTIPAEKAKNGFSHRVPLSKLALELLGPKGEGFVFPSPRKELGHIHRAALAHALRDHRERLGIAEFSPHDLRRTAASLMAGSGVNPFTVERVLNHALQGVQKIYNRHSYDAEKREALETWAQTLERIVDGRDVAEVIPIHQKVAAVVGASRPADAEAPEPNPARG